MIGPGGETIAAGAALLAAGSAYALLSGADFGGGIWDLFAGRGEAGGRLRAHIDASITPVWEANHVWLVFILVWLWGAFSPAFAAGMTALFVPLAASLLGIVLRGLGFAFRHEAHRFRWRQFTGALFAISSLVTPYFFGTVIGAVVTGSIPAHPNGNVLSAWTNTTAILTGFLFVSACAYISAIYLVGDVHRRGDAIATTAFARRATVAAVATGGLAAATFAELSGSAPRIYDNLTGRALPLVAVSFASGIAVLVMIWLHQYRGLRLLAGLAVAAVIWGWGWSQYPELLPHAYSLAAASSPSGTLLAQFAALGLAIVLVVPGFALLFRLQNRGILTDSEAGLAMQPRPRPRADDGDGTWRH